MRREATLDFWAVIRGNLDVGQTTDMSRCCRGTFTFVVLQGDDDEIFRIDSSSGMIFVRKPERLNFENVRQFELTVQISDNFELCFSDFMTYHHFDITHIKISEIL